MKILKIEPMERLVNWSSFVKKMSPNNAKKLSQNHVFLV